MRYELEIVAQAPRFPTPDELASAVSARGIFQPQVVSSAGFDRPEDSPRLLLEEESGARVLVAFEREPYAAQLASELLLAPAPLRQRLSELDRQALRAANAAFRLSVVRPGADPANAVRFQVQIADALVDRFGGVLLDPQVQLLWGAESWRSAGTAGDLDLRRHLVIHAEDHEAGLWVHTHGMLRFGKPDLELFEVPPALLERAAELLSEVARYLVSGGEVAAGDTLAVGGAELAFCAGGAEQPNDFDNECLRIADALRALQRPK
jgi:hypothetical protein